MGYCYDYDNLDSYEKKNAQESKKYMTFKILNVIQNQKRVEMNFLRNGQQIML